MQQTIDRPVILVTGATGAQGTSVAKALLEDDRWLRKNKTKFYQLLNEKEYA